MREITYKCDMCKTVLSDHQTGKSHIHLATTLLSRADKINGEWVLGIKGGANGKGYKGILHFCNSQCVMRFIANNVEA